MSTRTYGLLAGVIGSAIGAWWWTRHCAHTVQIAQTAPRPRGTVIFDNTPTATDFSSGLV